jgi:N-acetylneuraminate synthase/N,N'-diacetyllegionaminate synthase
MQPVRLGARAVGPGAPCLVAAEVGINHNGDLELAHAAIDAAASAGADAVKFQNYRTEDFVTDRSLTYEYVSQGRMVVESQYDMFKRCELSTDALRKLREHCDRRGVVFFSTPTSAEGVGELTAAGAPLLKNGSDYLTHLPLIRTMAQTGLPTVLSTGMATSEEIAAAVAAFRDAGGTELVLLHCTSSYPTPDADVNLKKIPALEQRFQCPVGLSDHTWGTVAAIAAVALGACLIEKHFTLDRELPGPDHRFSADPTELQELIRAVRRVEANLGSAELRPAQSEEQGRNQFRLSCVAARDLPAGHILTADDISFARPGTGVPPGDSGSLVGERLERSFAAGELLERPVGQT